MSSITRAKEVQRKRQQELHDGAAGIRKREAPKLFSVAFADWTEAKRPKWSERMAGIAESSFKHLAPAFGKKLVVDIEARDIRAYQKARAAEGASNRTINIEVGCVRAVLKRSGAWARIQPNVEMLRERDDVGHALTTDEESALLAECGKSRSRLLLPFVVLALETGARRGTLQRLQWGSIDFANRCLTFGRDKTAAGSGRTIPLTPRAAETLTFWAQQFPTRQPEHYVFARESYGGSGSDDVFGFTGQAAYGTDPTRPTGSVKTAWESARERTRYHCLQCKSGRLAAQEKPVPGYECGTCHWRTAELPPGLASVRIHDLRHSAASRLIANGTPLPIVGKILGWSAGTLAKMAARYGHFGLDAMRTAMESASGASGTQNSVGVPKKVPIVEHEEKGDIQ